MSEKLGTDRADEVRELRDKSQMYADMAVDARENGEYLFASQCKFMSDTYRDQAVEIERETITH